MTNEAITRLNRIMELVGAASGREWAMIESDADLSALRIVQEMGGEAIMRISRESEPASPADVRFIAHCRADATYLVDCLRAEAIPDWATIAEIADRCAHASRGPWEAFLESEPGMAGSSFIRIGGYDDSERDMYLWFDDQVAPDDDLRLVASMRADLPWMLSLLEMSQ